MAIAQMATKCKICTEPVRVEGLCAEHYKFLQAHDLEYQNAKDPYGGCGFLRCDRPLEGLD
eukprot:14846388-Alexandrium_andersonii.AAC.1